MRKFPNDTKEEWITLNRDGVDKELKKYEGMFDDEPLKDAFEKVLTEFIFLSESMNGVNEWKQDFVRYLLYAIDVAENQTKKRDAKEAFHAGRLSVMKEILEWF